MRSTRRQFLAVAGTGLGSMLVQTRTAAARSTSSADGPYVQFRSRPDLVAPAVAVLKAVPPIAPGYVFLAPSIGPGQHGPLILDDNGDPVWIKPHPRATTHNFRRQTLAGRPVLTWWEGGVANGGYGEGQYVIADTSYREIHRFSPANGYAGDLHEFTLTPRGTALISIYDAVSADLSPYGGPAAGTLLEGIVQELDVRTRKVLLEWHSRDHVALGDSYRSPDGDQPWDYFHLNSIAQLSDGNLLVSARHTSTVYKIDRRTGEVLWRLGGKHSDFRIGPGAAFAFQHHARGHADGRISIFDNASYSEASATEPVSRAILLQLDSTARTATLVREDRSPHGALSVAMGDAQVLADGGMFVGWGTAPYFSEFSAAGELRFDAKLVGLGTSYRTFRHPWDARPSTRPAIAAVNNGDETLTVYASWNGATKVVEWQVLGGDAASSLGPLRTVRRTGFETEAQLGAAPPYVAVAALDARGGTLGTSKTLATAGL
jgi:Arylsulfotransferase (ASST)